MRKFFRPLQYPGAELRFQVEHGVGRVLADKGVHLPSTSFKLVLTMPQERS